MIIGMIRYAIPNTFSEKDSKNVIQLYADPYFTDRFNMFCGVTLKSFANQTCKDFILLVYHSRLIPADKKKLFDDLEKEYPFIKNLYIEGTNLIIPEEFREEKMLTFRIDNDDGITTDFIERLQNIKNTSNDINFAISIPRFYQLGKIGEDLYQIMDKHIISNSMGLAYYSNDGRSVMDLGMHHKIPDRYKIEYLESFGGLQIINGYNVSNHFNISDKDKVKFLNEEQVINFLVQNKYSKIDLSSLSRMKKNILFEYNKKEIAVSVIIPVYNVEKYLRQCLDSIINQTLKNIEIICVDDGSTDSSLSILNEYKEKDKRIIVLTQQNQYAGVARNNGLSIAKGKYLSFLDSDDFFEKDMLENMYYLALKDNSDVVCCGWKLYNNALKRVVKNREILGSIVKLSPCSPDRLNPNLFSFDQVNPWSKLFKREIFIDNNIKFEPTICSNDFTGVATALACAKQISITSRLYVTYRSNQTDNVSAKRKENMNGFLSDLNSIISLKNNLDRLGLYEKFKLSYIARCRSFFIKNSSVEQKKIIYEKLSDELYELFYKTPKPKQ